MSSDIPRCFGYFVARPVVSEASRFRANTIVGLLLMFLCVEQKIRNPYYKPQDSPENPVSS